jgi:hypothetical protein
MRWRSTSQHAGYPTRAFQLAQSKRMRPAKSRAKDGHFHCNSSMFCALDQPHPCPLPRALRGGSEVAPLCCTDPGLASSADRPWHFGDERIHRPRVIAPAASPSASRPALLALAPTSGVPLDARPETTVASDLGAPEPSRKNRPSAQQQELRVRRKPHIAGALRRAITRRLRHIAGALRRAITRRVRQRRARPSHLPWRDLRRSAHSARPLAALPRRDAHAREPAFHLDGA